MKRGGLSHRFVLYFEYQNSGVNYVSTDCSGEQIKNLVKEAILELVGEQREVLYDALAEVIEDLALAQAIQEGKPTETASRAEVLKVLASTV